ncbi:MAG: hypothetical protein P4M11_15705 [Candidatus Pacebacteria bacterium]|nr:hypothetical protein [Candidatus Paceibacterota bacterium]
MLRTHLIKKRSVKEEGVGKLILAMCITERRLMSFAQLLNSSVPTEGLVSVDEWEVLSAHKMQESKILKERHQGLKKRIDALYAKYRAEYAEIKDEDKAIEAKIADLLHRLKARYPQYELNGNRNIWIVKPAGLSRGRGIHMFWDLKKLTEFIRGKHYVVQKYIENPLIILNRKVQYCTKRGRRSST